LIEEVDGGRKPSKNIKVGSVEATIDGNKVIFDVDLFNPNGNLFKHRAEVKYNGDNNITTHPGDFAGALNSRGLYTGVRCKKNDRKKKDVK